LGNPERLCEDFEGPLQKKHAMPSPKAPQKSRALYFFTLFLILVLGSVALVYGVSNWAAAERAKKLPNPAPLTEANIQAGKAVYANHCVQCHGDRGDGNGQKSQELSVEPGNFTDARKMSELTDGQLYWQITKGRNPMPAFEDKLPEFERWQAVDYIRGFAHPPTAAVPGQPPVSKQP
jgi:mono/diheme cytochrome c family protein